MSAKKITKTPTSREKIQSKILLLDIETSPIVGLVWKMFDTNVAKKIKSTTILSVAYQWIGGETKVISRDNITEKQLLRKLHKLLDDADIVIAQNGDSFDIKKINARFIVHRFNPPSPYRTVDTLKVSRSVSSFDSHSLENLGNDLDEGEKIKHRGIDMWWGCMNGNNKDWHDMKRYNKKDVDLLARIYLRLRTWIKNHPRTSEHSVCQHCGSSDHQSRGYSLTSKGLKFRRLQCVCGAWRKGKRVL